MSATHDPLTKAIEETRSLKAYMMKLIVEQSIQIKQMETEMEKMVWEKEKVAQMASTTMEALTLTTLLITTPASVATGAGSSAE